MVAPSIETTLRKTYSGSDIEAKVVFKQRSGNILFDQTLQDNKACNHQTTNTSGKK